MKNKEWKKNWKITVQNASNETLIHFYNAVTSVWKDTDQVMKEIALEQIVTEIIKRKIKIEISK